MLVVVFFLVCPSLHHPHRPKVGAFTQILRHPPRVPFCLPMHSPTPTDQKSGSPSGSVNPQGTFMPAHSPTPTNQKSGPPPGSVQSPGYLSARPLTDSHRPEVWASTRIPSTLRVPFCPPTHCLFSTCSDRLAASVPLTGL